MIAKPGVRQPTRVRNSRMVRTTHSALAMWPTAAPAGTRPQRNGCGIDGPAWPGALQHGGTEQPTDASLDVTQLLKALLVKVRLSRATRTALSKSGQPLSMQKLRCEND
eukprot:1005571-Prymnesium_polylepis.2